MERSLLVRAPSSTLSNRRYSSVPCLQLPANTENPRRSLPTSPIGSSSLPIHEQFSVLERKEIDLDFLQTFNFLTNEVSSLGNHSLHYSHIHFLLDTDSILDNQDLMNTNADDELSILDLFDPYRQSRYSSEPEGISPDLSLIDPLFPSSSSPSFTYPIKLRLKLSTCSEMKPFSQLVQRIRNEYQTKEVKPKEFTFNSFSLNFRI